jgi:hypothetical protein
MKSDALSSSTYNQKEDGCVVLLVQRRGRFWEEKDGGMTGSQTTFQWEVVINKCFFILLKFCLFVCFGTL